LAITNKSLGKRHSRSEETFEEEGLMEWDRYNDYFKVLTKEDKERLLTIVGAP
jgi:hypothetical protein